MDENKIKQMTVGGKILGDVLSEVLEVIKPGMTESEVDMLAEKLILEKGAEVGFKKVYNYQYATCLSVNNVVVHGLPTARVLQDGDIIGVDCGVFYGGFHTDMSETIRVRGSEVKKEDKVDAFLKTGKEALLAGISEARAGNRVGHISRAIQGIVEGRGYSVVRNLVGHGVGKDLHEKPEIPGYLKGKVERTPLLVPGMTLAIEVIYNQGKKEAVYEGSDDWTIITLDGSLSGVFERTILVTDAAPIILTQLKKGD